MKSKQIKYQESVERNLKNLKLRDFKTESEFLFEDMNSVRELNNPFLNVIMHCINAEVNIKQIDSENWRYRFDISIRWNNDEDALVFGSLITTLKTGLGIKRDDNSFDRDIKTYIYTYLTKLKELQTRIN